MACTKWQSQSLISIQINKIVDGILEDDGPVRGGAQLVSEQMYEFIH